MYAYEAYLNSKKLTPFSNMEGGSVFSYQYASVKEKIQSAVINRSNNLLAGEDLSKEVVEVLLEEGFDVTQIVFDESYLNDTEISWNNATEKYKKGQLKIIDRKTKKIKDKRA